MGNVILLIKVLPNSLEAIDDVKSGLEAMKPERLEEELIGFGMKFFKATFVIPDEGGNVQEDLENKIRDMKGVSDIEILMATRSL